MLDWRSPCAPFCAYARVCDTMQLPWVCVCVRVCLCDIVPGSECVCVADSMKGVEDSLTTFGFSRLGAGACSACL